MRADRLLAILLTVQMRGKATARDLAEHLEVSERTIYRDIDALSAAGVPVYAERGPGGGIALLENYQTQLTGLNENEVQALSLFSNQGALSDLGLSGPLNTALIKLSAALPQVFRQSLERSRKRIYLDPNRWFSVAEEVPYLHIFQTAVWEEKQVKLQYGRDQESVRSYALKPYGLVAKVGIWYVVGQTGKGLRTFRISRVQSAELSETSFQRPADFDLTSYWHAWVKDYEQNLPHYPVTLRAHPEALSHLSYHTSISRDTTTNEPDPTGWHELTITFENLEHAVGVLVNVASKVEIVAPLELRERLIRVASGILELYKNQTY